MQCDGVLEIWGPTAAHHRRPSSIQFYIHGGCLLCRRVMKCSSLIFCPTMLSMYLRKLCQTSIRTSVALTKNNKSNCSCKKKNNCVCKATPIYVISRQFQKLKPVYSLVHWVVLMMKVFCPSVLYLFVCEVWSTCLSGVSVCGAFN